MATRSSQVILMTGSTTDWLAARETVDARSRSKELAKAFASVVGRDAIVVDLGCGTGSNIRYLAFEGKARISLSSEAEFNGVNDFRRGNCQRREN
jgi:tRNA G46 methylase TrmB